MYGEIEALERCYEDGCRVINMSFGANFSSKSENKLFRELKKKGIILIASAGNNGVINSETTEDNLNSYSYPACDESVIAVGAVQPSRSGIEIEYYTNNLTGSGQTGHKRVTWTTSIIETLNNNQYEKCDFSTANDSVFISAPGRDIYTLGGIAYSYCSGTSIAAPIVSAAAIGVKQMRPYVDTDMFKEILKATSVDLDEPGYDINTGWGMVDFQAIYDYVSRMPEAIVEDTPNIEIDYENSTLKGISDEKVYQVNGEEITPINGEYAIPEAWFGTTISIQVKATEQYHIDSEIQEVEIPQIPDAPIIKYNIIFDEEGSVFSVDGITEEMEFRKVGLDEWTTGEITSAGEYEIRYKAKETSFPSITYVITFEDKEPEPPVVHEYDVDTSVSYDNGTIRYEYTNYLENNISATGIIAIYDTNNCFVGMYTIDGFDIGTNSGTFAVNGDVGSVKFFVWKDVLSLQPYEKAQTSIY